MKALSFSVATLLALASAGGFADTTTDIVKRNVSKTPDTENEFTLIGMMPLYVHAQASDGTLVSIDYEDVSGGVVYSRDQAKPLITVYSDGPVEMPPDAGGFIGHGERDTFGAVSLDDGLTWKRTNLSKSADLSSFTLDDGTAYPGDVIRVAHAVSGNKVLVVWQSRYCAQGTPGYTLLDDLGLVDLYSVAGAQGSSDFADEGYPTIGEVPFACVWTARGTLEVLDDGTADVVWRKAERLTSGESDANRIEPVAAPGGGFAVVWQEDPEGLRPGDGEGPGEGFSGAVANKETDVWYSAIKWTDFDLVLDADGSAVTLDPNTLEGTPQVAVNMTVPVRLTDNEKCYPNEDDPYCYADLDADGDTDDACASTTDIGGVVVCVTDDGVALTGTTAATRPRLGATSYTNKDGVTSAWVAMNYEESKGLGDILDPETGEPLDIGKNARYQSFEMFAPTVIQQGMMLNQPAVDWTTCNEDMTECDFFDFIYYTWDNVNPLYDTEIARRGALMTQPITKIMDSESKTSVIALYKQGLINSGGPADIMVRRFVVSDDFDPAVDNPYAAENMVCEEWDFEDGTNPNYLDGVCLDPAINISANTPTLCDGDCTSVDPLDTSLFPTVLEWEFTVDNLDDQSWENPLDVAKGHRGFLDYDFIMLMYAWAPNWKLNAVGHDHYNLYIRRSFDGGLTWTTTPPELGGDGTTWTEIYYDGTEETFNLAAGEFEPGRNVSLLTSFKDTVLDPRFSPTAASILTDGVALYPEDVRDRSKYFAVYETGDNTTTAIGEPTPQDLFYSRGEEWGDEYYTITKYLTGQNIYIETWDALEHHDPHASEASLAANSDGSIMYGVWFEWSTLIDELTLEELVYDSDSWFARVLFVEDDSTTVDGAADTSGGGNAKPGQQGNTGK